MKCNVADLTEDEATVCTSKKATLWWRRKTGDSSSDSEETERLLSVGLKTSGVTGRTAESPGEQQRYFKYLW